MSEPVTNPHDKFFKQVFSQQEIAADFLRNYLPPAVVELLDLSTLELTKDSFIDPEFQQHFSDLLYKARRVDRSRSSFTCSSSTRAILSL